MRLDKFLANQGFGSRKDAKKFIKDKRIKINGVFAKKPEDNINPLVDEISIDDDVIEYKENYYFMLNKPKGYICATEDNFQNTVLELIPEYNYLKLFPGGRLDKDTTGLLLITTDGDFAHKLISPKRHVDKVYIATLDKDVDMKIKNEFESGIILDDELTLPAKIEQLESNVCKVTLHQGKYHQVKRMFEYFGYKVIELHREKFAFLTLGDLQEGEYRELTDEEVNHLKML
jgi:16S rRNA pseudouridine516 synthase